MNTNPDRFDVIVKPAQDGLRLDKFLALAVPDLSRSRMKALIEGGDVHRSGDTGRQTIREPRHRVKSGECYSFERPRDETADLAGEAIGLNVVYEDRDLVVVDKPPGLVVHPGSGHQTGTLVHALLHHCPEIAEVGARDRPGIVHRLDKGTSGLLVAAKTAMVYDSLVRQFADHTIGRRYTALVKGLPRHTQGTISAPIGRHPRQRRKMAVRDEGGKKAETDYRVVACFMSATEKPFASLVEARLRTGRTHQVRVHMAHIGHPLLGDRVYGRALRLPKGVPDDLAKSFAELDRQALHAAHLSFEHPRTREHMSFNSPLPPDFAALLTRLERDLGSRRFSSEWKDA